MALIDRSLVLSNLGQRGPLTLEIGCGPHKRYPGSIGVDAIAYDNVDIVGDALEALRAFPSGSAELITSSHFLEHVPDVAVILDEMARVVRAGGRIEVIVPHFAHPYFASDPTHENRFGLYTLSYFARDDRLSRKVPDYVRRPGLRLCDVDLVFKSSRPFVFRHVFKRVIGAFFNSCRYLQELWEENFCYLFPCYEIRFLLEKSDD